MPLVNSRRNPLTFALAILCYLLVFGVISAGFAFVTGRAHPEGGIVYKVVGAFMVVAGTAVLGATVRRWSRYLFAVCFLMAVKALFALLLGYTISQPRLVVNRILAAEVLGLLVAMMLLSYRYSFRPPRTALESIGLVSAVVALALELVAEPNIWPVVGAVLLLALPRLLQRAKMESAS